MPFGPDGGPSQPRAAPPPPVPPAQVGTIIGPEKQQMPQQTTSRGGGGGGGARAASSGGGGGTPVPAVAPRSAAEIEQRIREQYPAFAFLLDIPEIRGLLIGLEAGDITEAEFNSKLEATEWWKTHNDAQKQWYELVNRNPAEAEAQRKAREAELRDLLGSMGALGAFGGNLSAVANQTLEFGLSAAEMRDLLVSQLTAGFGSVDQLPVVSQMRQVASDWMVPLTDSDLDQWARQILSGDQTVESFQSTMQDLARGRFPHLLDQINAGVSPGAFFAPYRNLIAQNLEITPEQIDFMGDASWLPVLSHNDGGTIRPMTLAETQKFTRQTPAYNRTRGATENAAELGEYLTRTFGATA